MRATFFHDAPLVKRIDGQVYSSGFSYSIWERYLKVFDSIIVSTRMRYDNSSDGKLVKKMKVSSGPKVYFSPISNYKKQFDRILNKKKIILQIREALNQSDYAIIRMPSYIGQLACKEAKKMGKPYLIEVVGCPWDALWNHSLEGKVIALPSYLSMKKAVKKSPYVVYVSNEFLQNRYPTIGKSIACSDVELPPLENSVLENRIRKIKNKDFSKPIILGTTAAIDVRYKGQEYVIRAISKLNKEGYNFEYHLVGEGDRGYLTSVAEKYGVLDKVHFFGSLPHDKVFQYLDDIDIYIQPSKQEGLPRALVEAMSRGCPSIGSTAGGTPELLNPEFVFRKGSVKGICNILKLLTFKKETMLKEANRSFEKAKEYDKGALDKKRTNFFNKFVKCEGKND